MKTDDQLLGIVSSAVARHRELRLELQSNEIEALIKAVLIDRACDDLKSVISDLTSPELIRLADLLAGNVPQPATIDPVAEEHVITLPPHPLDAPQTIKKRRGRPPKSV